MLWGKIKRFFKQSETIAWARVQSALGAIALVLTYVEPELVLAVLPSNWIAGFLLVNGVATEYLRRRRATFPDDDL